MGREFLSSEEPQRLGKFILAARMGSGGQGVVYEAYDPDGIRVAIKVLRPEATADATNRGRFAKEAAAAKRVASFCTARIIAAEVDADKPYIVSEFIQGPDLSTAVREQGPFTDGDLLRLATGIVTALTAIHEAGVVHRDLKPGNVLLGPHGPRVIDFGIARTPEMSLGQLMATGFNSGPVQLRDPRNGQVLKVVSSNEDFANKLTFSSDGSTLATGSTAAGSAFGTSPLERLSI